RHFHEAMVPAHFARLDALPRAPLSGKLDRKALPEIAHSPAAAAAGRAAKGEAETLVATAFSAHLKSAAAPGADADFFLDLGGASLVAAQVTSTLRRAPRTASLTVRDLYETRTVAGLAARVVPGARAAVAPRRAEPDRTERVSRFAAAGVAVQC